MAPSRRATQVQARTPQKPRQRARHGCGRHRAGRQSRGSPAWYPRVSAQQAGEGCGQVLVGRRSAKPGAPSAPGSYNRPSGAGDRREPHSAARRAPRRQELSLLA